MSKIELKPGIFIEGFDNQMSNNDLDRYNFIYLSESTVLYRGKTSEIPEELAKELVDTIPHILFGVKIVDIYGNAVLFKNYKINKFTKRSGKRSIRSACPFNYCIIYKTTQK